jgi:putative DNA-invertase from lambdoid prophage Rac
MASFAEFEREMIRERVAAGLRAAKENGTRSGLAIGRPKGVFDRDAVLTLRTEGNSWSSIASRLNVGITTVRRVHRQSTEASQRLETGKTGVA